MFRFYAEDEYGGEVRTNLWKERGTGDAKFLKNIESKKIRLVMRQEKTGKVCANFIIDPRTYLVFILIFYSHLMLDQIVHGYLLHQIILMEN